MKWEIPWHPQIVIISPLHSSIPNAFLQKQIYGNPPDAYPLLLSKPHEGSQTCFFPSVLYFQEQKHNSIVLRYNYFKCTFIHTLSKLDNVDFGLPYHCSKFTRSRLPGSKAWIPYNMKWTHTKSALMFNIFMYIYVCRAQCSRHVWNYHM